MMRTVLLVHEEAISGITNHIEQGVQTINYDISGGMRTRQCLFNAIHHKVYQVPNLDKVDRSSHVT